MNIKQREILDIVIITTLPHYIALYYTIDNLYYSLIIVMASSSSVLWHIKEHDPNLYMIDHILAVSLSGYEIINNFEYQYTILSLNIFTFLFCKFMDILSFNEILHYDFTHSAYHLCSSLKTIYVASIK